MFGCVAIEFSRAARTAYLQTIFAQINSSNQDRIEPPTIFAALFGVGRERRFDLVHLYNIAVSLWFASRVERGHSCPQVHNRSLAILADRNVRAPAQQVRRD